MVTRPFPVSSSLTAISIAYTNDRLSYIADALLPRLPVGSEKFNWLSIPIGQGLTFPDTLVGRRGRVARVEFSGVQMVDQVEDHGLEDAIPQSDIREAAAQRTMGVGTFDPVQVGTEMLTNLILLDREIRVATKLQNPATYPAARRLILSGGDQFSDYVNSKPIDIIKSMLISSLMFRANTMAMGRRVFDMLSSHPHIVNAIRGQTTTRGS